MRIIWDEKGLLFIPLREEVKRKVEEQVAKIDPSKLENLREYEVYGDEIVLEEPDSMEGQYVKIVKHKGKFMLVAGNWEHEFREEYYVAEVRFS